MSQPRVNWGLNVTKFLHMQIQHKKANLVKLTVKES
jgi:hypothetical protein